MRALTQGGPGSQLLDGRLSTMATVAVRVKRREGGVGYQLGVDIGTTHTAAAVLRDGEAEICTLGQDSAAVPSVVFLATDGAVVVGNAAREQGFSDPTRVARAFKRHLGEPTPITLGGASYSADELMAKLVCGVVDIVADQEGGRPDLVTVSHPANWGAYRTDLLTRAVRGAGLESFRTISDAEAVALFHRSAATTTEGDTVLVYDLGGGTFDVSVARTTSDGVEVVEASEGIDRLGGIDFDEAVLAHISGTVGVSPADFEDDDDPATAVVLARLREECAGVKEALSTATEVSVPVFAPGGESEVRVTRDDFEALVRPAVSETIEALRRTLGTAGIQAADLGAVVLAGGSSRIPLVARLVSEELGRPVPAADRPKHVVALGAAMSMVSRAEQHDPPPVPPARPQPSPPVLTDAADGSALTAPTVLAARVGTAEGSESVESAETPTSAAGPNTGSESSGSGTEKKPPAGDAPARPPSTDGPSTPSMSPLMSIAAVGVALVVVAAAIGAGTLIAVGRVTAGIGLVVVGVAAGVALLLMVRSPSGSTPSRGELSR